MLTSKQNKLKITSLGVLTLTTMLTGFSSLAATYQFFFNNIEQGANSTATPQLQVTQDPKTGEITVDKTESGSTANPASPADPGTPTVTPPATAPSVVSGPSSSVAQLSEKKWSRWKLSLEASFIHFRSRHMDLSNADAYWEYDYTDEWGALLSFGWQPIRQFGLQAYLLPTRGFDSAMGGLEASFSPVQLSIGSFENFIEPSVFAGAWTDFNSVLFSVGGKLSANFSPQWSIDSSVRVFVFASRGGSFSSVSASAYDESNTEETQPVSDEAPSPQPSVPDSQSGSTESQNYSYYTTDRNPQTQLTVGLTFHF